MSNSRMLSTDSKSNLPDLRRKGRTQIGNLPYSAPGHSGWKDWNPASDSHFPPTRTSRSQPAYIVNERGRPPRRSHPPDGVPTAQLACGLRGQGDALARGNNAALGEAIRKAALKPRGENQGGRSRRAQSRFAAASQFARHGKSVYGASCLAETGRRQAPAAPAASDAALAVTPMPPAWRWRSFPAHGARRRRCRSGAGGRSSARNRAASLPTAPASRRCAGWRTTR